MSMDGRIVKKMYVHTMKYYSALKKTQGNHLICANTDKSGWHYAT